VALNDLPLRVQPSHATLKVHKNGKSLSTGPPNSRHKDRNSFKFGPLAQDLIVPSKSLSALYMGHLYVEVVYEHQPQHNLVASMALQDLYINEPARTVVLSLAPKDTASASAAVPVIDLLDEAPLPTVKLQLQLRGSLRPEIETLRRFLTTWFTLMDRVEASCCTLVQSKKTFFVLVPAVPVLTGTLVVAPIVAGLCVVFLPLFIPILVALLTVAVCGLATGGVLVASTSTGRKWVSSRAPLETWARTTSGQALLYPTGPRPNPVRLTRLIVPGPDDMWGRLILSLITDVVGSASYLVPVVGETTDLFWAPLQTILIMALYDTTTPHLK
jgi:hypothetical protein